MYRPANPEQPGSAFVEVCVTVNETLVTYPPWMQHRYSFYSVQILCYGISIEKLKKNWAT